MGKLRQHTVPRFYLEDFFPGLVYRRGEKSPRFTRKARNLAVRVGYYGAPDEALIPLDKMNSVIENEAAPVLKRIVGDVTTMSRNDWVTLSYFFANMAIRSPAYHLSQALGHQACRQGYSVLFTKASRLLADLGGGKSWI